MKDRIRNFSIIAHIDHGKSTLADRLIEETSTLSSRQMSAQILDSMDLERERGITIKSSPVMMKYSYKGDEYTLNMIDTPGHVDFSYEVSRSLEACEAAILVVDATQGIQAQTLANMFLAMEKDLTIIPVINKIDLPAADVDSVCTQIEELLAIPKEECILCSAKTGLGITSVLEEIIIRCPPPKGSAEFNRALVFDSVYDNYRGALPYVRMMDGTLKKGMKIKFCATGESFDVLEVGIFSPGKIPIEELTQGMVGYVIANIRSPDQIKIGDTIVDKISNVEPLKGFRICKPVVFAGIYPTDSQEFEALQHALSKLMLNDSALSISKENSATLGFGFRCGFLGLLHLEIVIGRLLNEFDLSVITCAPSVMYRVHMETGEVIECSTAATMPEKMLINYVEEPWVVSRIIFPAEYMGAIMSLALEKRGICINTDSIDGGRVLNTYHFPMSEIITDFSDMLKSCTRGFGSFDYEMLDYRRSDIVKMVIMLNGDPIDAFSSLIYRDFAEKKGRALCKKLEKEIPRSLIKVAIQAAVDNKIIARTTIDAMGKDVTDKCYGGDRSRKDKLLKKQRAGKKRMRQFGKVKVPHEVFMKIIKDN